MHERFDRDDPAAGSSERGFGIVFAVVFGIVAAWPLLDGRGPRLWALAIALLFLAAAFLRPALLTPLNRQWTRLALLLHRVVNPIVMGLLLFVVITPFGLVRRLFGRDPMRRRFDPAADSYWIRREVPGPAPETMTKQF